MPQVVALANLRPNTVDMTLALVPSLSDLSQDDITEVLQTLSQAVATLLV